MSISNPLKTFPVTVALPVVWGELDAFQHVNNTVYFRYFESARLAYFMEIGFVEHMEATGVGPILASTSCRFRRALTFPDNVFVGATVTDVGDDRFTMQYRVYSEALGDIAAEGDGLIVCYNYREQTKAVLPGVIRDRIIALSCSDDESA